ncbi:MAG: Hpt domain-containing protein [Nitrospira sp.]|nr:Hpt domain-containing protein [Nitrospira sp.]
MNHTSLDQSSGAPQAPIVHIESDFEALLPKFMANRKKEVAAMREALAQRDFETIRKIAHGMKGAGGSYGFDLITTMGATMEQAAKSGAADPIRTELDALATYLERVQVVFD